MKNSTPSIRTRQLCANLSIALLLVTPSLAETTKPKSSPAPAEKKTPGMLQKLWPFGKKEAVPAPTQPPSTVQPTKKAPAKKIPDAKPTIQPTAEESKPGMLSKLWPFGKKAKSAETKPAAKKEIEGKNLAKKTAEPTETKPAQKESSGFMSRIWPFGEKKEEKPAADSIAPKNPGSTKTSEAMKNIAEGEKPKVSPDEPKKSEGFFSRIFGGGSDAESSHDSEGFSFGEKPIRPDNWEEKAWITEQDAPGYLLGPAQASPDIRLAKGTMVTLKKRGRDWTDVLLEDGRTMTVAADQVQRAAKEDFADPAPPIVMVPLPSYQPIPADNNLPTHEPDLLPGTGELLLMPIPTEP